MGMDSLPGYLASDGLSICKQTPATNSLQVIKSEWQLLDQVPPGSMVPHGSLHQGVYRVWNPKGPFLSKWNAMTPSEAHSAKVWSKFLQSD